MKKYTPVPSFIFRSGPYGTGLLMNSENGKAYKLNATSALIWQLLDRGRSVSEIRDIMAGQTDLPEDTDAVIENFCEDMLKQGFVTAE